MICVFKFVVEMSYINIVFWVKNFESKDKSVMFNVKSRVFIGILCLFIFMKVEFVMLFFDNEYSICVVV